MKDSLKPLSCNTVQAAKYIGVSEGFLRKLRALDEGPAWIRIGPEDWLSVCGPGKLVEISKSCTCRRGVR